MLRLSIVIICASSIGGVAAAEPVRLTDEMIQRELVGALLRLDTPLRTTVPVRIGADGLVSADAGPLASMLGSAKDRGRWWIDHDQLCVKWFRWFDAKTRCLALQREGNRIYWQEADGEMGSATLEARDTPPQSVEVVSRKAESISVGTEALGSEGPAISTAVKPAPVDIRPALHFSSVALGELAASLQSEMSRVGGDVPTAPAPPAPKAAKRPSSAVRLSSVKLEGPSESTDVEFGPSFRVASVEMGDALNVRSGPSEFDESLGSIPAGGRGVHIIGHCEALWCPVRYRELVGWANARFLTEDHTTD